MIEMPTQIGLRFVLVWVQGKFVTIDEIYKNLAQIYICEFIIRTQSSIQEIFDRFPLSF